MEETVNISAQIPGVDFPMVLFDGHCSLCNHSIDFFVRKDHGRVYHYAPLQSPLGKQLQVVHGLLDVTVEPDSVLLIEDGVVFDQSTAALRIAKSFGAPFNFLALFLYVPRFIRDLVYRFIAANRFRIWGRQEHCRLPRPEERAFLLFDASPALPTVD